MRSKRLQSPLSGDGRIRLPSGRAVLSALAVTIGVMMIGWLTLVFAPRIFVPPASEASLRDVEDPARQLELQNERLKLQNDVRTTLVQGLGGAVVLIGVYFTFRQFRLNEQGQITERFTRAVEQLGSAELPVRVGGIAALGRIASDSARDHEPVMETLAAFVRVESAKLNKERKAQQASSDTVPRLRADLQVAATILGQRPDSLRREESRRINLRGVLLGRVHLRRAHYEGVALTGADFRSGQLTEIHFNRALLRRADFEKAVLEKARFTEAFLLGTDLRHARLGEAMFDQAWVFGADFRGAQGASNALTRAYCDEGLIVAWMKEGLKEGPRTWAELREILDTPNEENLEALRKRLTLHDRPIDEEQLREGMRQIAFFLEQKLHLSESSSINYERITQALKNVRSRS